MNFKANKIIVFCNRKITHQISSNWGNSEYIRNLLEIVVAQSENPLLKDIDFKNLINYILYNLGNYYRGNTIFIFQILVAFLYLITPVDVVNDFIPGIGYLDDLLLLNMILTTYKEELDVFISKKNEHLDIKYMSVEPKVIEKFQMEPTEAIDLIIKDKKLKMIEGEKLINEIIIKAERKNIDDYIEFDTNDIIKYELINHLLYVKTRPVKIDEEIIADLIQIKGIVEKKDINYFMDHIEEFMYDEITTFEFEKKSIFSSLVCYVDYEIENLLTSPNIKFVQVESTFTNERENAIKYRNSQDQKLNYATLVEIIDLVSKHHIFEKTIIQFEIVLKDIEVNIMYDVSKKQMTNYISTSAVNVIGPRIDVLCQLIEERVR